MLAEIVMSAELKSIIATVIVVVVTAMVYAVIYGRSVVARIWSKFTTGTGKKPMTIRNSDQPAPSGTADYLRDLATAAPEAPSDFVLKQAMEGATIAKCQRDWITELLKLRKGAS